MPILLYGISMGVNGDKLIYAESLHVESLLRGSICKAHENCSCRYIRVVEMQARTSPLIRVDMAVEEDIDSILVQQGFHGLPHLVVLLEGGICAVPGVVSAACHPVQQHPKSLWISYNGEQPILSPSCHC